MKRQRKRPEENEPKGKEPEEKEPKGKEPKGKSRKGKSRKRKTEAKSRLQEENYLKKCSLLKKAFKFRPRYFIIEG